MRCGGPELRATWRPILVLAIPGVVVTAAVVGGVLTVGLGLPLATGVLFGSIVAATDPVAVTSVFKELRVPSRLSTIAEGESRLNDGMAVTLFAVLVAFASPGADGAAGLHVLSPLSVATFFGREVVGGVLIGAAAGIGASRLTSLVDNHFLEMTLSTALAYGSYLLAHSVGASGPIACVIAGGLHGSYGRRVGMSEHTRRRLDDLWEYLGFLANGLLFLLVGFSADVASLRAQVWPVLLAVAAVSVTRVLVVEGATYLIPGERSVTSGPARSVLMWGGIRGALTMALALALPLELAQRPRLEAMALGVVLFTLVVQGVTLRPLIRWVGLGQASAHAVASAAEN